MRVGLIQFGSVPRLEFSLDSYSTKQELKKHLKKIPYRCVSLLLACLGSFNLSQDIFNYKSVFFKKISSFLFTTLGSWTLRFQTTDVVVSFCFRGPYLNSFCCIKKYLGILINKLIYFNNLMERLTLEDVFLVLNISVLFFKIELQLNYCFFIFIYQAFEIQRFLKINIYK